MSINGSIAVVRFGLGGAPGEIAQASKDPQAWLRRQINPAAARLSIGTGLTTQNVTDLTIDAHPRNYATKQERKQALDLLGKRFRKIWKEEHLALFSHWQTTTNPFAERWVSFWANHFTVSLKRPNIVRYLTPFWRDAIRPNVFGQFADLLEAATLHPAMLSYLDNNRSFGPNSLIGKRGRKDINENLAREVLELHTLGVDGGYTQSDVEAFAAVLSGWMPGFNAVAFKGNGDATQFLSTVHEPGSKTVLGKRYRQKGGDQAKAVLSDLAHHPSTAQHIAFKLARHFIADDPPKDAVSALRQAFDDSGGNLSSVAHTLISLDAVWSPRLEKAKTHCEFVISASRVFNASAVLKTAFNMCRTLGQPFAAPPSPAGWPDVAEAWLSPDAVKKRLEWSNRLSRRGTLSGEMFLKTALGDLAEDKLKLTIKRAGSQAQAITLALMSPAFQRR